MFALTLPDADATLALGEHLAACVRPGLLVTLRGELGAGKTTLTKGLIATVAGLEPDDVLSPTFNLVLEYDEGPFPLRHLDAYRLADGEALVDLGFLDWLADGDGLIVLEWPERVPDALPEDRLELALEHDQGRRRATLMAQGEAASEVLAELRRRLEAADFTISEEPRSQDPGR